MRYLLYLRVSTLKQNNQTQLDHCLEYIKRFDKTNFTYIVFTDKVRSKKPLKMRPGGKELLKTMKKGDTIIAMRVDRISRSTKDLTTFFHDLEEMKINILLVEQPQVSNNKILLGLFAGMAEEEVKLIRKRISENLYSKSLRNERYSRYIPYGYEMHPTKLVPVKDGTEIVMKKGFLIHRKDEQEVLSLMSQYFAQGKNYQQICEELNNQGYKNRQGKPFQKMSIYRILRRTGHTKLEDQLQEEKEFRMSHSV